MNAHTQRTKEHKLIRNKKKNAILRKQRAERRN